MNVELSPPVADLSLAVWRRSVRTCFPPTHQVLTPVILTYFATTVASSPNSLMR